MNKKEFQDTFKALVDGIADGLPLPRRLNKFAKSFSKAPETLEKWYNGVSAPANASREVVIKYLYEEQKKKEFTEAVKNVIRNELKIEVVTDKYTPMYEGDSPSFEIILKLGDEVIYTEFVSLGIYG